jgi:hypothetical protein
VKGSIVLPAGVSPSRVPCPRCQGSGGFDGENVCGLCHGAGQVETETLRGRVVSRCTVPHGPGRVCGWPFYDSDSEAAVLEHTRKCLSDHHEDVVAERERQHPSIMRPWDPEFFSWVRDPGRARAIMEGRVKP